MSSTGCAKADGARAGCIQRVASVNRAEAQPGRDPSPGLDTIFKVARGLGVPPATLFRGIS